MIIKPRFPPTLRLTSTYLSRLSVMSAMDLALAGCASKPIAANKDGRPLLKPEEYFAGETHSWGIIETPSGKPKEVLYTRTMGRWDGSTLHFEYVSMDVPPDRWPHAYQSGHSHQVRLDRGIKSPGHSKRAASTEREYQPFTYPLLRAGPNRRHLRFRGRFVRKYESGHAARPPCANHRRRHCEPWFLHCARAGGNPRLPREWSGQTGVGPAFRQGKRLESLDPQRKWVAPFHAGHPRA